MKFKKLDINLRKTISFFFVGALNTVFGYFIAIFLLISLKEYLKIFYISILVSCISILFSFATYKILYFRSTKKTFSKLIKAILVYSALFIFNALLLNYFIVSLNLSILLSQLIVTTITVIILYFLHNHFTFKELS